MHTTQHGRLKGLGYFCALAGALFLFFSAISPRIVASSPALQQYGAIQEFLGIHSGLMYYTDLKTMQETQDTVRYALERAAR
ncbi:MAG: hypothetical protein LBC79_07990 [Deltaproteobacteria bacterium]|jgi:hypothetical protein|nr:hypothetical protein [Deltaproteobacteria bacterium]